MVREIRGDDLSVEPTARQSAPPRKSLAAVELPVPFIDWEDAHSTCSGMRDDGEPEHNRSRSHYRQTKFTMAPKGETSNTLRRRMRTNVRFGSLADILTSPRHVRFTPKSGHAQHGH